MTEPQVAPTTQLRLDEFDFATFFERTPDLVCIVSKDGRFRQVNESVLKSLGYKAEELIGKTVSELIHPDDKELTRVRRAKLIRGQALVNFQNRYLTKTGEVLWFDWTSIYLPEQEVVFAIAKDVTARKKAELEVEERYDRIRQMADHFKSAIEEDRSALALELHEDLAQLASVVKMDIAWVRHSLTEVPDSVLMRLNNAEMVADLLVNTIRRMSFTISPVMIQDLGIAAALDWHCQEFSQLSGVPCQFKSECTGDELKQSIKMDLFRVCQEALNNVMYHAKAKLVRIHLRQTDHDVILSVTDDGNGFNPDKVARLSGLTRMRERAASINGSLVVNSSPGLGTTIIFSVRISDRVNHQ